MKTSELEPDFNASGKVNRINARRRFSLPNSQKMSGESGYDGGEQWRFWEGLRTA